MVGRFPNSRISSYISALLVGGEGCGQATQNFKQCVVDLHQGNGLKQGFML